MLPKLKKQSHKLVLVIILLTVSSIGFSQKDEDRLQIELGVGFNHAFKNGFADINELDNQVVTAKSINLPTLNLGLRYMITEKWGAKLDLGYNRFSNASESPDFKINYTRINAQAVYDYSSFVPFFPEEMSFNLHGGPGYTMVKPLGVIKDNDQHYLNVMVGTQALYAFSRSAKAFIDVAYVYGVSNPDDYIAPASGLGAFNGSIFTFTVGVSLSLSGCYFCN